MSVAGCSGGMPSGRTGFASGIEVAMDASGISGRAVCGPFPFYDLTFVAPAFLPQIHANIFSANTSYLSGRLIFACLCIPVPGEPVMLTDKKTPRLSPRGVKFRQRTRIDVFRWFRFSGDCRLAVLTGFRPQAPATCHLHAAGCLLYRGDKFRIGFDTTL